MEKNGNIQKHEDEALLLVKGGNAEKGYAKKLADAIKSVLYKHDVARMRTCGAPAVNNAIKAFTIASLAAEKFGEELYLQSEWVEIEFKQEKKTALLLVVRRMED